MPHLSIVPLNTALYYDPAPSISRFGTGGRRYTL